MEQEDALHSFCARLKALSDMLDNTNLPGRRGLVDEDIRWRKMESKWNNDDGGGIQRGYFEVDFFIVGDLPVLMYSHFLVAVVSVSNHCERQLEVGSRDLELSHAI